MRELTIEEMKLVAGGRKGGGGHGKSGSGHHSRGFTKGGPNPPNRAAYNISTRDALAGIAAISTGFAAAVPGGWPKGLAAGIAAAAATAATRAGGGHR